MPCFAYRLIGRIHSLPSSGRRGSGTDWRPHDHEDLAAARAFHGCRRAGSDRRGRTMRPRTRRHGRNHPGLRPVRRQGFGTAGPVGGGPGGHGQTKRHLFIPERSCSIAYADRPIPIGLGQTISQPFIVALMTQLAEVAPDHVVLEVGRGWGYQAAILAHLARKVCTIEIIPSLAEAAAKALRDLAYDNVSVRLGDGYGGWPECGPFDAIVVTAALGEVPPPLIEQLKVGGRLVMPVGPAYTTQHLTVVEKIAPGKTTTRAVALLRFVPFPRHQD